VTSARSLLLALAVLALLTLTAGADAQSTSSQLIIYGGPGPGGKLLSAASIPVRPEGEIVVTFHGDAAAGCATYGLCPYSGTIVVSPKSGDVGVEKYRRHGHIGTTVSVLLNPGAGLYLTAARVERSTPGQPPGLCADTEMNVFDELGTTTHGAAVTIGLFTRNGTTLSTRCAGPLDGDLAGVGPTVTLPLGRLARGHTNLNLSGTGTFSAHGFAGTISSTLVLHLGKPSKQTNVGTPTFPPGIKPTRMRIVTGRLKLSQLTGDLSATVQGTANPVVCQSLDSCGLVGTLRFGDIARRVNASVTASGPASRPDRDFLAALGLSSEGNPRGISVGLFANWMASPLRSATTQFGSCTDSAPAASISLDLTARGGELRGFASPESPRTRCPGPEITPQDHLLTGSISRRALRHRTLVIRLRAGSVIQDDGYTATPHGGLSLTLKRGAVSQTEFLAPTG